MGIRLVLVSAPRRLISHLTHHDAETCNAIYRVFKSTELNKILQVMALYTKYKRSSPTYPIQD